MLLRLDVYRLAFTDGEGLTTIVSALVGKANFQLQYQLIFCLWTLTFNVSVAERVHKSPPPPIP